MSVELYFHWSCNICNYGQAKKSCGLPDGWEWVTTGTFGVAHLCPEHVVYKYKPPEEWPNFTLREITSMTFEEFLQKTYDILRHQEECWMAESYLDPKTHDRKPVTQYDTGLTFHVTWSLGGTSNNCWGEHKEVSPDTEPADVLELDVIIENLIPGLSFMQYKGIVREVIERGEKYHSDYYGGSTTEAYKGFKIKNLYEALAKRNLL